MRSHRAIATTIAASLVIGFGAKLFFFSSQAAEAQTVPTGASMNVLQMHLDHPNMKLMPVQLVEDPV
jgi:hypothetical protein